MLDVSQLNLRDNFYEDDKNLLLHLDDGIDSQVISCNSLFPQKHAIAFFLRNTISRKILCI